MHISLCVIAHPKAASAPLARANPLQLEASRRSIAFAEASWCYPALGFRTPNESIGRWPGCCNETSPAAFRDALPIDHGHVSRSEKLSI
jgi:hypothetical protein